MLPLINLGYTDEVIFMAGGIFIYVFLARVLQGFCIQVMDTW